MRLRHYKDLGEVVKDGLLAVFPHVPRQVVMNHLGVDVRLPSQIDAALCSYYQRFFSEEQYSIYVWADSSPQAGHDWLLSMLLLIPKRQLANALAQWHVLLASVDQLGKSYDRVNAQEECVNILHERMVAGRVLKECMLLHRQVPAALAHGASSLDHKARLLTRKFVVESLSPSHASNLMNNVVVLCTDMGTEGGLADVT
eukprot:1565409-Amphidinium_carterae.1